MKPTKAEMEHWNRVLASEGLSMERGNQPNKVIHVENPDDYQLRKTRVGVQGGRVSRYKLGERVSYTKTCPRCAAMFIAKRADARFCSQACQKYVRRTVTR